MPEGLAGKRLLIVEEALRDYVGHWYEYVRSVVELNRAAGVEVHVAAHADAGEELRRDPSTHPLFTATMWDGVYRHRRRAIELLGPLRHNVLVFRTMRRFLRRHGPFDCVFVPTVMVYHVWAWRLLWLLHRRSIGRLVLLIRNSVATYRADRPEPVFGRTTVVLKRALLSFADDFASGRAAFATDSDRLAEEYRQLSGVVPTVFPSPRIAPLTSARAPHEPGRPVVFACLGPARFEKGIDVLQRAIARYLDDPSHPPGRFVVQWNMPIADEHGQPYEPDAALLARPEVAVLREPLDSAAYDEILAMTDCMVLPYRRNAYFARISGVAVEAVTAGIPVIYTQDTWTADLVSKTGAGIGVDDGDAAGLAAAMAEMARDYDRYGQAAEERREAAQAEHTGEAFMRKLWGVTAA